MTNSFRIAFLALTLCLAAAGTPAFAADAPGGGTGEPQLLRGPNEGLITGITTLIVFLLLVVVLGRFAWGPIVAGLKTREDKIRDDIARAERARADAEARLKEYEVRLAGAQDEVRAMFAKATGDAEKVATGIRMQAQQESEEAKERALKDIDAARKDAVREVYEQAAILATSAAEKILRRNLNADDQRDLVAASLEQLESVAKN